MKLSEIVKAWEEGKDVQEFTGAGWKSIVEDIAHFDTRKEYRLAPTINCRAWKPEEVPPVGTAFRSIKNPKLIRLLIAKDAELCTLNQCPWTFEDLLEQWEYSTDGEKTWHKCGVEES